MYEVNNRIMDFNIIKIKLLNTHAIENEYNEIINNYCKQSIKNLFNMKLTNHTIIKYIRSYIKMKHFRIQ